MCSEEHLNIILTKLSLCKCQGKLLVNGQKVLSLKRRVDGKHMKQTNGMVSISLESRITLNVSWTGKSYPANPHLVKQPLFRLLCEWVKIIRTEKKLFSIIVFNYRGLRKREKKIVMMRRGVSSSERPPSSKWPLFWVARGTKMSILEASITPVKVLITSIKLNCKKSSLSSYAGKTWCKDWSWTKLNKFAFC